VDATLRGPTLLPMRATFRLLSALMVLCLWGCKGNSKPPTDPKVQAQAIMECLHKEDWKTLYSLFAVTPQTRSTLEGADKFAANADEGMHSSSQSSMMLQMFRGMSDIKTGVPTINGDKATVPTSCKVRAQGESATFKGVANLVLDDGQWKWDLTGSDDIAAEMNKQTRSIIGNPTE
jgi:hypothetical protein